MSIADVMAVFKHPQIKAPMTSGRKVDYIPSRKIVVPVNRENVIKYGIMDEKYAAQIPDSIVLTIAKDKINKKGHSPAEMTDQSKCIGCAFCATMCPDCVITVEK